MSITFILLATLAIIAMLAAAFRLGQYIQRQNDQERRISALEEKVEHAPKRLANRTIAGIEDAQAILIDLLFQHQAEEARLDNLRDVLSILRRDPNGYDSDRPAGLRK